jgi:beta-lactam-binding protein with PASTA domain
MHEREVKSILDSTGLLVGRVIYTRSPKPLGTVIQSSYAEGSIAYAYTTAIDFIVSGGEDFDVNFCPDVLGKPSQSSKTELESFGFDVVLIRMRDNAEAGTVISQYPSPADAVNNNSHEVRLMISGGPTYTQALNVVNVIGQNISSAETIIDYMLGDLCTLEITVTYTASLKPKGTVIAQKPQSGVINLTTGMLQIELTVSGGPSYVPPIVTIEVPDVAGMYLAEAEATLLSCGIKISNIRYVSPALPAGKVFGQTVPGGQTITGYQGQLSIELVISSGPPPSVETTPLT